MTKGRVLLSPKLNNMRNFIIKSEIHCNKNNEVVYISCLHSRCFKILYYQKKYTIFGLISFTVNKEIYEAINNEEYPDPFFPLLFSNREEMYSWIEEHKTAELLKKYFEENKKLYKKYYKKAKENENAFNKKW